MTDYKTSEYIKSQNEKIETNDKYDKLDAIIQYTGKGYRKINGQLINLTNYYQDDSFNIFDFLYGESYVEKRKEAYKKEYEKRKEEKKEQVKNIIFLLDYCFHLFRQRDREDTELILYRTMRKKYDYLNEVGDKMVIENYTSTVADENNLYVGDNLYYDIIKYKIILSPHIPFIDTTITEISNFIKYPDEKEIILPRNLVATLEKIEPVPSKYSWLGYADKYEYTIRLTPLYETQFELEKNVCFKRKLYDVTYK